SAPLALAGDHHRRRHGGSRADSAGAGPCDSDSVSAGDGAAGDDGPDEDLGLLRHLDNVVHVTDWSPLVGALPAPSDEGPAPLLFGVTGRWR
ncbi:MAG TPA: hypothetical protein VNO55_21795, partial [Polyangia bacterium]|nr:hypothetical protein [Polyangia bacterium]